MTEETPTEETAASLSEETPTEESGPTEETGESLSEEERLEDAREDVLDFLEGLLDSMDLGGDVVAELTEEGGINAAINGEDVAPLIGRHGQTLDALQELLRTVVQRQAEMRVRVNLDIEGYRERRKEVLVAEAQQGATRAVEDGEYAFEPMTAYERKIIHDAVSEIPSVMSVSEGEDPSRRVILHRED